MQLKGNKCKNKDFILCGAKDKYFRQICVPKNVSGCPIRNLKIIKNEDVKAEGKQIQNNLNPLGPFPKETDWQYIKFDDKNAIGVSYNAEHDPIVSIAFLEKAPCMNNKIRLIQTSFDKRKYVMKNDKTYFSENCNVETSHEGTRDDLRYRKVDSSFKISEDQLYDLNGIAKIVKN